jgi:hypothetical protein
MGINDVAAVVILTFGGAQLADGLGSFQFELHIPCTHAFRNSKMCPR